MPALVEGRGYCGVCNREVPAFRLRPRHALHAVLSVVTGGVWLPIWLIFTLQRRSWRCATCRSEASVRPGSRQRRDWVVRHFPGLRELPPWPFFWRVNVEGFLVGGLAGGLVAGLVGLPDEDRFHDVSFETFLCAAVLVAPVLETLVFQAIPVHLVRLCRGGFVAQVAISTVLFAAPHFLDGPAVGVSAGVVGGFYLALTYAHWAGRATRTALWMTVASHALHNFVVLLVTTCAQRG